VTLAAVTVAALALLFTVASFWWIQVRRGRLVSYEPQTYSGYIMGGGFRLRLPLTIYNTGATTLVVIDLRLSFVEQDVTAPVITFRRSVKAMTGDVEDYAHPFAVPGRSGGDPLRRVRHEALGSGSRHVVPPEGRSPDWRRWRVVGVA